MDRLKQCTFTQEKICVDQERKKASDYMILVTQQAVLVDYGILSLDNELLGTLLSDISLMLPDYYWSYVEVYFTSSCKS